MTQGVKTSDSKTIIDKHRPKSKSSLKRGQIWGTRAAVITSAIAAFFLTADIKPKSEDINKTSGYSLPSVLDVAGAQAQVSDKSLLKKAETQKNAILKFLGKRSRRKVNYNDKRRMQPFLQTLYELDYKKMKTDKVTDPKERYLRAFGLSGPTPLNLSTFRSKADTIVATFVAALVPSTPREKMMDRLANRLSKELGGAVPKKEPTAVAKAETKPKAETKTSKTDKAKPKPVVEDYKPVVLSDAQRAEYLAKGARILAVFTIEAANKAKKDIHRGFGRALRRKARALIDRVLKTTKRYYLVSARGRNLSKSQIKTIVTNYTRIREMEKTLRLLSNSMAELERYKATQNVQGGEFVPWNPLIYKEAKNKLITALRDRVLYSKNLQDINFNDARTEAIEMLADIYKKDPKYNLLLRVRSAYWNFGLTSKEFFQKNSIPKSIKNKNDWDSHEADLKLISKLVNGSKYALKFSGKTMSKADLSKLVKKLMPAYEAELGKVGITLNTNNREKFTKALETMVLTVHMEQVVDSTVLTRPKEVAAVYRKDLLVSGIFEGADLPAIKKFEKAFEKLVPVVGKEIQASGTLKVSSDLCILAALIGESAVIGKDKKWVGDAYLYSRALRAATMSYLSLEAFRQSMKLGLLDKKSPGYSRAANSYKEALRFYRESFGNPENILPNFHMLGVDRSLETLKYSSSPEIIDIENGFVRSEEIRRKNLLELNFNKPLSLTFFQQAPSQGLDYETFEKSMMVAFKNLRGTGKLTTWTERMEKRILLNAASGVYDPLAALGQSPMPSAHKPEADTAIVDDLSGGSIPSLLAQYLEDPMSHKWNVVSKLAALHNYTFLEIPKRTLDRKNEMLRSYSNTDLEIYLPLLSLHDDIEKARKNAASSSSTRLRRRYNRQATALERKYRRLLTKTRRAYPSVPPTHAEQLAKLRLQYRKNPLASANRGVTDATGILLKQVEAKFSDLPENLKKALGAADPETVRLFNSAKYRFRLARKQYHVYSYKKGAKDNATQDFMDGSRTRMHQKRAMEYLASADVKLQGAIKSADEWAKSGGKTEEPRALQLSGESVVVPFGPWYYPGDSSIVKAYINVKNKRVRLHEYLKKMSRDNLTFARCLLFVDLADGTYLLNPKWMVMSKEERENLKGVPKWLGKVENGVVYKTVHDPTDPEKQLTVEVINKKKTVLFHLDKEQMGKGRLIPDTTTKDRRAEYRKVEGIVTKLSDENKYTKKISGKELDSMFGLVPYKDTAVRPYVYAILYAKKAKPTKRTVGKGRSSRKRRRAPGSSSCKVTYPIVIKRATEKRPAKTRTTKRGTTKKSPPKKGISKKSTAMKQPTKKHTTRKRKTHKRRSK
jgi:hypothetical protein